jgi:hypothetical protein
MSDKFELYDVLSVIVPGTLLLALTIVAFPSLTARAASVRFPDAFAVIILLALAVFVGSLVQSIASLIEPILNWSWGGRPSAIALKNGLGTRYLPADTAMRIRRKLATKLGSQATDRSLFLYAMQQAETSGNSRVAKFNALYAYHRAIFTLILVGTVLLVVSMRWGAISQWSTGEKIGTLLASVTVLLLVWHRTKQRGFYYVREVLSTAERIIDRSQTPGT